MSDFYSYLNGQNVGGGKKEAPVMDELDKKKRHYILVECHDCEGTIPRLLKYIGENGNGGHSFDIVVDPDCQDTKKTFFWDGDGADRMGAIVSHDMSPEELPHLLLNVISDVQSITFINPEEHYSEEELKRIIMAANDSLATITSGVEYRNPYEKVLRDIKIKAWSALEGDGAPPEEMKKVLKEIEDAITEAVRPNYKEDTEEQKESVTLEVPVPKSE